MEEDVSLELAEEEERQRPRLGATDRAGLHGAREVIGEHADHAARRHFLIPRIERHHERGGVHLHGDRGADDVGEERDQAFRELGERDAGIGLGVELRQCEDEVGNGDGARGHGSAEERLLGVEVPEDGRGGDVEGFGDVGQRRRRESPRLERGSGGVEDLRARDARRAAHG